MKDLTEEVQLEKWMDHLEQLNQECQEWVWENIMMKKQLMAQIEMKLNKMFNLMEIKNLINQSQSNLLLMNKSIKSLKQSLKS